MSGIAFSYCEMSPPCRAVKLAAAALDIKFATVERVRISENQHKTKEFLQMNPQHLLPTIKEGADFTLWESRAIMKYLVTKSTSQDAKLLYPDDAQKRAKVNQWLDFDACNIIPAWGKFSRPVIRDGKDPVKEHREEFEKELSILNTHLAGREFVAGTDHPTLADLSLAASISSSQVTQYFPSNKIDVASSYPNIGAWLKNVEKLSYYEKNQEGIDLFKSFVEDTLVPKPYKTLLTTEPE